MTDKKAGEVIEVEEKSKFEEDYVHKIYDEIAHHFSNTRYKGWPSVLTFLKEEAERAIQEKNFPLVCDVGCGNGKYLVPLPGCSSPKTEENVAFEQSLQGSPLCMFGTDRSFNLLKICAERCYETQQADNLQLPYLTGTFDIVISIAVIHHLSTNERRMEAISELFRIARPGARIFIQVWAFEQQSKRKYEEQDVFVPWHLNPPKKNKPKKQQFRKNKQNNNNNNNNNGNNIDNKDNEELVVENKPAEEKAKEPPVFLRYYHLFKKGELDELIKEAAKVHNFSFESLVSEYEKDNWYSISRKL